MNWRTVAASVIGTSHLSNGSNCQDSCYAQVRVSTTKSPLLSIFVTDGAGSATNGGEGAEIAIEALAVFVSKQYELPEFELNSEFALACVKAIRERIISQAEEKKLVARDFACTFLGVLSIDQCTLVMQIGDGGIVLDVGDGLNVPIIPMTGEYANMTHFVTDESALDILVTKIFPEKVFKVAVFTDGLQRLALNMATNTAYEPFFAPFFKILSTSTADDEDHLQKALCTFLNSQSVNDRTDDDKTLAIAVIVD